MRTTICMPFVLLVTADVAQAEFVDYGEVRSRLGFRE